MTPEQFASRLLSGVVDENMRSLDVILSENTKIENRTMRDFVDLFRAVDEEGRRALRRMLMQVSIDAVSAVLAIVDGRSFDEGDPEEFVLLAGGDDPISGELQTHFLRLVEVRQGD